MAIAVLSEDRNRSQGTVPIFAARRALCRQLVFSPRRWDCPPRCSGGKSRHGHQPLSGAAGVERGSRRGGGRRFAESGLGGWSLPAGSLRHDTAVDMHQDEPARLARGHDNPTSLLVTAAGPRPDLHRPAVRAHRLLAVPSEMHAGVWALPGGSPTAPQSPADRAGHRGRSVRGLDHRQRHRPGGGDRHSDRAVGDCAGRRAGLRFAHRRVETPSGHVLDQGMLAGISGARSGTRLTARPTRRGVSLHPSRKTGDLCGLCRNGTIRPGCR
jgi:hypothetical protein